LLWRRGIFLQGMRVHLTVDAVGVADPGADLTVLLYR
jgi:hypothetical protein